MSGILHATTEEIIAQRFPGRVVLSPEEVAEVWRGSRSRQAVGTIRKRLTRGTLVPGLKKNGGRWEVPVAGLIKAVERLTSGADEEDEEDAAPVHPQAAPPSGTRRRAIGPRMSDTVGFWSEVFAALDRLEAERMRAELGATVMGWKWIRAEEHERMVRQVMKDPPGKTYTDDELAVLAGRGLRTLRNWRKAGTGPKHSTKKVTKRVSKKRTLDVKYTEIIYTQADLVKWLKSRDLMEKSGFMMWNTDEAGHVARTGDRETGSLLDLLQCEHASSRSLAWAMALYSHRVADDLDDAAWRLAAMPLEIEQPRVF
ncbi:hypothetical protein [Pseudoxanthomonas broegbernensis]|nr:hypothetical protein [Pseudoxanthomonas broegbernensis]MBB6064079.1 hypothetical protein [Pseudoxanthomonas broegbernensis]